MVVIVCARAIIRSLIATLLVLCSDVNALFLCRRISPSSDRRNGVLDLATFSVGLQSLVVAPRRWGRRSVVAGVDEAGGNGLREPDPVGLVVEATHVLGQGALLQQIDEVFAGRHRGHGPILAAGVSLAGRGGGPGWRSRRRGRVGRSRHRSGGTHRCGGRLRCGGTRTAASPPARGSVPTGVPGGNAEGVAPRTGAGGHVRPPGRSSNVCSISPRKQRSACSGRRAVRQ